MAKWLTFYFNHVGGVGRFSTLKFDPLFNDLLNLVETYQMAYISFQQVKKGGCQFSTLKRYVVTLYIIIYFTLRTLTFKDGEMAYLSFQ